jgi:hypothetical protein
VKNNVVLDKYSSIGVRSSPWITSSHNTVPRANQSAINWWCFLTNSGIPQSGDAYMDGSTILIQGQSDSRAAKNATHNKNLFLFYNK